jgi:hypothetical protein
MDERRFCATVSIRLCSIPVLLIFVQVCGSCPDGEVDVLQKSLADVQVPLKVNSREPAGRGKFALNCALLWSCLGKKGADCQ